MRRYLIIFGAAAVLAAVAAVVPGGSATADGGRPFVLDLSGANEFDSNGVPVNVHGDADRGSGVLRINSGRGQVCVEFGPITLTSGEALPNNAHIHRAAAGVAGGVVVPLFNPTTAPTSYPSDSICVAADKTLLKEIIQSPEGFYVNLHNPTHPAGVMRDQLHGDEGDDEG